jgi:hypothetical protein
LEDWEIDWKINLIAIDDGMIFELIQLLGCLYSFSLGGCDDEVEAVNLDIQRWLVG